MSQPRVCEMLNPQEGSVPQSMDTGSEYASTCDMISVNEIMVFDKMKMAEVKVEGASH